MNKGQVIGLVVTGLVVVGAVTVVQYLKKPRKNTKLRKSKNCQSSLRIMSLESRIVRIDGSWRKLAKDCEVGVGVFGVEWRE